MRRLYQFLKEESQKPIDDDFMNHAFEIMMEEEKELYPFISSLDIQDYTEEETNDKQDIVGDYHQDSKKIHLYRVPLRTHVKDNKIAVLGTLRHELEHARNLKNYLEGGNDIESTLIQYGLRDYGLRNHLLPREHISDDEVLVISQLVKYNNHLNPDERISEIKAWEYMVNLLKNDRESDDLNFARSLLLLSYQDGYFDNRYYLEAPTLRFLINTGMLMEHNDLLEDIYKKQYSFATRVKYGLPLTYSEYEERIPVKVKLPQFRKSVQTLLNEKESDIK